MKIDPNQEAAGHPGEHSREVLKKIGYSDEVIETLLEKGVVSQYSQT